MTGQQDETVPRRTLAQRYLLREVIGRGGMGVVWLADDQVIGRQVAVKELRLPDGQGDGEREVYQERVLREVRTTGRLNDPGVVTVFDVISEGAATFIVMELIQAPTLGELIKEHGALAVDRVLTIAEQVLSALDSAHAAGVVHRDVKPSNIMVLPGGRVKLTDFGIAQALDDPRLTTSGTLVGSPAFMAPERISHSAATPASDLWSLGATLFHAVEGCPPFERQTTAATMHAIMTETPQPRRCGGPLATVISGLLITSPEARLNTTGVRGLLGAARAPGPQPPNGTISYQNSGATMVAERPEKRGRWLLPVAFLLVAAAGAAGGYFLPGLVSGESATPAYLTYGGGGQIPEFEVSSSGESCLIGQLAAGRSFSSSSGPSCDEPHDAEVFWSSTVVDSSSPEVGYLGVESMAEYGDRLCRMMFDSALVPAPDKADTLTYTTLVPTEQAYRAARAEQGYPTVYCVLSRKDGRQMDRSMVAETD